MRKFDNKGLGFSLNKVLFSILLLVLVIALSFPLFSVEKKMKCFRYGGSSKSEVPEFYKYSSDILGKQKFFVREENKWIPFCEVTENVKITRELFAWEDLVLNREVGKKAIECFYSESVSYSTNDTVYRDTIQFIDFELNFTKMCLKKYENKDGETKCATWQIPNQCELIKD